MNTQKDTLLSAARTAYTQAYAPYSHYQVGAAVLSKDERIFSGCNVENAVYPLTICAERVAITKAVSEGARHILAVAVVTRNGGTPCGSCRQVIHEFAVDDNIPIWVADTEGHTHTFTLGQLLPHSFSNTDLV